MPWPFVLAAGLVALAGAAGLIPVEEHGEWPAKVSWEPIQPSARAPATVASDAFRKLNLRQAEAHSYFVRGPRGHGTTTRIFWLCEENVFYLYSDCGQNHVDDVLGPFTGDPRVLLDADGPLLR